MGERERERERERESRTESRAESWGETKVKSKETNRKIEVLRKIIVKMIDLEHNTGTTHVHVQ